MQVKILSSREFNQDVSGAKRMANISPVIITDRGTPSHVLLSIEAYKKINKQHKNLVELLAMPNAKVIEFEAEKLTDDLFQTADLS